ncbi:MAG: hypothetical protein IJF73_01445 [Clostridia bacterium]|nr:hypothetical protein [Clostridia bacterium]
MKHRRNQAMALLLALCLILVSLTACGDGYYKPVDSTELEATPVFTLGEDTVNYEMLYTFFHNRCENIPSFSAAYFTGEEGDERFREVMDAAIREIASVYAMLTLCREVEIDPYSEEMDTAVNEVIKTSVDGGTFGEYEIRGFDSYKDYLAYLRREFHMNDAVNRLMMRYAECEEALSDYYAESYAYTEADVRSFFESEDCLRILWVSRFENSGGLGRSENLALMESARQKLRGTDPYKALQYSLEPTTDFHIGRHTLDRAYYGKLIDAAYALPTGGVSEVMDLGSEGLFVLRRMDKQSASFSSRYEELAKVYLGEVMYGRIEEIAAELMEGIVYTEFFSTLTAADILGEA